MATELSVLVPYRRADDHRERVWEWVRARWELLALDFPFKSELVVCSPDPGPSPRVFNHPVAINRAAAEASGSVFIIADADTAFAPEFIVEAVELVSSGEVPWVLPRFYDQLDRESTLQVLEGPPSARLTRGSYNATWRGDGAANSGLVVVPRAGFEAVGGYDERWDRWGGDDVAFRCAMDTLHGEVHRLEGAAMHLWHSRDGLDDQPPELAELMRLYIDSSGDAAAMRELRAAQ